MLFFLLLALFATAIYVLQYYRWVAKYPKGPTPYPLVGNLLGVSASVFSNLQHPVSNAHVYMEELSKNYGHMYTLFLPRPFVVLTDYAHLKEAFVNQGVVVRLKPSQLTPSRVARTSLPSR